MFTTIVVVMAIAAVSLSLVAMSYRLIKDWHARPTASTRKNPMEKEKFISSLTGYREGMVGRYFGPIAFNIIFRIPASIAGGLILASTLTLPLSVLVWFGSIDSNPINLSLWALMSAVFAVWFGMNDNDTPEIVPEAHAAMITFFRARRRIYRTEGEYYWTGKRLFLDRSRKVSDPGTDKVSGFVYLGEIPIRIWNSAQEKDVTRLSSVARDSSSIYTTLVVVLKLVDPYLWVDSQDALGDVAERARHAFRTAVAFFVGTDVAHVKSILGRLMSGVKIVTAFLQKTVGTEISRSMLENRAGVHQYIEVRESEGETVEAAKRRFVDDLNRRRVDFDPNLLKAVSDTNGKIVAEERSISETLDEVANAVGARYLRASVGNITLSDPVEKKANEAASEVFQRDAQVASAKAIKEAREELKPSSEERKDPYFQDAAMVAAAQDNPNISVVHVTGSGDRMTRAAATHASQMNKKGTK